MNVDVDCGVETLETEISIEPRLTKLCWKQKWCSFLTHSVYFVTVLAFSIQFVLNNINQQFWTY